MSTLSQFAPFAGGGLKSFQTGYVNATMGGGSGEDAIFTDVTTSAVDVSKTITAFQGSSGSNNYRLYSGYGGEAAAIISTRMTSTTNLRLASRSAGQTLQGRWQAAEAS
jgi:hypothetical protein